MLYRYEKTPEGKLIKKALVYTREEHRINVNDVDGEAVFITGRLRASGYESYIVGGAVRDLILGKKPKDFDIVTGATPAKIKRIFRNSRIIGRRFRLVHVFFGPKIFEVSTFRSLKDGHTSNTYGTIEEDVQRRDFSFNALYYDPGKQVVVDYVGGMEDIKKKRLKPIIPPELIFADDPVRMIRAVKYAAAVNFTVPWLLLRRIKKEAALLEGISPSRLTEEMTKIIRSPRAAAIVESLEDAGVYGYLQKEASALLRRDAAFRKSYLANLEGAARAGGGDSPEARSLELLNLAALLRDYLERTVSWDQLREGTKEEYRAVFFDARRFLLPVNLPRTELEKAVRLVFAEHGIDLKRIRLFDRERKRRPAPASVPHHKPAAEVRPPAEEGPEAARPRRRRRRRRRPGSPPQ
ncbi:MAG: polynucleotide adenylyltransferase PcnB [Treponema sp.]|nr:polynucleotide adenylyltransferase PcnB [Treponema sp.]